jgi:PAS domain S-box-containing protein
MKQARSAIQNYAVAIASAAAATGLRLMLSPILDVQAPFVTCLIAVTFTAWYAGLGPALISSALGAIAAYYFILTPQNGFPISEKNDVMRYVTYLISCAVVALFSEAMRRARGRAEETTVALAENRKLLSTTLASIGDGVIATDEKGLVAFMNPVAETLTGWSLEDAVGKPLEAVFNIVDEQTRAKGESPLAKALRKDETAEIAHHSALIKKDGAEIPIDDSGSPIRDDRGNLIGVVIVFRGIAERRRAEAKSEALFLQIRQERERLTRIVANVPGVVWEAWGHPDEASQRIDFVSRHVEEMLGHSVRDWLETPNFWLSIVHPDDRERAAAESAAIFAGCVGGTSQFRWMTKDGRAICVEAQSAVICDEQGNPLGMRGVTMDITERVRSAEAQAFLAEASRVLVSSLDYETTLASVAQLAVPELADWCMVHIVEEDGRIRQLARAHIDPAKVEWAKELERRYPMDQDAPHGVSNALRTGKPELYAEVADSLLVETARDEYHLKILRELGLKSAIIAPLIARNRTLGAITFIAAESGRRYDEADLALAEDLARRAAIAADNAMLYREANRARAEAEQANRLKDEFLATVSHELRTPLNAIIGWSYMLSSKKLDKASAAHAVETIDRNAKAQAQIVEDILDVSRIITGKLRLDFHVVELAPIIDAALDAVRPAAAAKGISIYTILDPLAGPVSGDTNRLQQIVWNIASNAIKFTPKGGRVELRLERASELEEAHAEIIVSDTGQGIRAELLPYVFDRFRQGDSLSARAHGGLGLGLAIVRHLVELHGGSVTAESSGEGAGAIFRVKLPLAAVRSEMIDAGRAQAMASDEMIAQPSTRLDGIKVMVIEGDRDSREVLKIMIEQFGAEVKTCASTVKAFEALDSWKPDILIIDIEMFGEDELLRLPETINSLNRDNKGRVPAVALTTYARAEDRDRALSAGCQTHIAKTAEPAELARIIAELVTREGRSFAG